MCPYRYRRLKFERWYCRDIINYQITERICKNVWKRTFPPPPLYEGSVAARRVRWSLQSRGPEFNSVLSTFICMHNARRDKNITWSEHHDNITWSELGKKQNIQAEKVFVLTPIKVVFLV